MDSKRGRWSAIGVAGWVWALATVSVLAGAAAFPGPGGTAAVRDPQRSPAVDDTLDAIGETLAGEGLAIDEREMDALAERFARPDETGGAARPWFVDLDLMEGYHRVHRASMGWRGRLRVTARRYGDRLGGYAAAEGLGPLRQLVLGGLRPRLGENTILGVRYSPFDPPGKLRDPDYLGLDVTPATAVWDPVMGIYSRWCFGRQEIGIAGWQSGVDGTPAARACWASVCRHTGSGEIGAAGGARQDGDSLRWELGGVSVYGGRRFGAGAVSAEVAAVGDEVFFTVRGRVAADPEWRVEIYEGAVPRGLTTSEIHPEDAGRRQWGAAMHRSGRVRGLATRVSLYTSARRYGETSRSRNRVETVARGRTSGGTWELSMRYSDEIEVSAAAKGALAGGAVYTPRREGQVRASWESRGEALLRQSYRLTVSRGGGPGAVGSMGWAINIWHAEVRLQCTGYSLPSGRTGHVARPGLQGGYETLYLVSGSGTDLCIRMRLMGLGGLRLAAYAGRPRRGQLRWYVSFGGSI